MNEKFKVFISIPLSFKEYCQGAIEMLERNGCMVDGNWWVNGALSSDKFLERIKDVDACIVGLEKVDREVLMNTPKLKIACKFGVGLDNFDCEAATERGVVVANAPIFNCDAVAEFTIGLMLALVRQVVQSHQELKMGGFRAFIGPELLGKTLGIIGLGNIGKRVARIAIWGLKMKVIAYDIAPDKSFAAQNGITYDTLDGVLRESDIVSLHVPLTPVTRGMIGKEELNLMKNSAYLINTARGAVVKEDDLYIALKKKKIAGAALDVWSREPPVGSRLLELPNVITTTHSAGSTYESCARQARVCAESVIRVLNGRKPPFIVNPDVLNKITLRD